MWGQTSQPANPSTGFSWGNASTTFGSTTNQTTAGTPGTAGTGGGPMTPHQLIMWIEAQVEPMSPHYRFRYPFYNKTRTGKPSRMSDGMYNQAMETNPDKAHLTPVLAEGFKDLKVRLEAQQKAQADHKAAIDSIKTYIEDLRQTHTLDVTVSLEDFRMKQMNVASRVLKLMIKLELLRHRQQSIQRGEEQFRTQIENTQRELNQPDQYKSRLTEIMSRFRMQEDRGSVPYPQLEEDDQEQICNVLREAGNGLEALVTDLKKDSEAVSIILEKYKESVATLGHI